jgi:hypothetical protein
MPTLSLVPRNASVQRATGLDSSLMAYAVVCQHCGSSVLTCAIFGDREASTLLAHLVDAHPTLVHESTSLGELLRNFQVTNVD